GKIEIAGVRLGRLRRRAERDPVGAAGAATRPVRRQRRALAAVLILLREHDAVLRRHLRGAAHRPDVTALYQTRLHADVPRVVPVRRIAGDLVDADARYAGRRVVAAVRGKEPQTILLDRTANRSARVVGALDAGPAGNPLAAQRVVDVVAARPVAGGV